MKAESKVTRENQEVGLAVERGSLATVAIDGGKSHQRLKNAGTKVIQKGKKIHETKIGDITMTNATVSAGKNPETTVTSKIKATPST